MNMLLRPASPAFPSPSPPSHAGVRSVRGTGAPACTPDSRRTTLQYATLRCHRQSIAFTLGSCSNDQLISFPGGLWRGSHRCARSAGRVDHAPYIFRCIFPRPAFLLPVAIRTRRWEGEKGPSCRWSLHASTVWANRMVSFMHLSICFLHTPSLPTSHPPFPSQDNVISSYEPHHLGPYRAWARRGQGG